MKEQPQEEVWAGQLLNKYLLSHGSLEVFEKAAKLAIGSYLLDKFEGGYTIAEIAEKEYMYPTRVRNLIKQHKEYEARQRADHGVIQ